MKKISAIVIALMLCCTAFTACGSSEESSEKSAESSGTVSDETAEKNESEVSSEEGLGESTLGELALAFGDKVNSGTYSMDVVLNSDYLGEVPYVMTSVGGNYYLKITTMGIDMEIYIIDSVTYTLVPDANMYTVEEDTDIADLGMSTYAPNETYTYVETKEEDGYTVEVYTVAEMETSDEEADEEALTDTVSYYFDGEENITKVVTESEYMGTTTVVFNSIVFDGIDEIVLPDLTDWVEMDDDTELDAETEMKLTLSMFGVTEEAVTAAGYTYADLAELDDEEFMTVLEELGVDLTSLLGDYSEDTEE